jgi:hypothetical protein
MPDDDNVTQLFTEKDEADLAALLDEQDPPSFHTVLEVWREILAPASEAAKQKVTPQWANRMVAQYQQLRYEDMNRFRDLFYGQIEELLEILRDEISTDEDCLSYTSADEDARENAGHYKEMLFRWQERILEWEKSWDCTSPDAAIELGAISETHKMFFGQTGIVAFLDNIGFQFTDVDSAELQARLNAVKEAK